MTKRKLDVAITEAEIAEFKSIGTRQNNIAQTIAGASKNAPESFFSAAFKHQDKLKEEEVAWWEKIQKKYNTPDSARCDVVAGCLFELIDDNGNVDVTTTIDPSLVAFEK